MRLTFQLQFYTHPGQSLWLTGNHERLGNGDLARAVPLHYLSSEFWRAELDFDSPPDVEIIYNYVLRDRNGSVIYDWGSDKVINLASFESEEVLIIDSWNPAAYFENVFYTEPFKNVLLRSDRTEKPEQRPPTSSFTHEFRAKAPLLTPHQTLCLVGDTPILRNWNTANPVLLTKEFKRDYFATGLEMAASHFPIEYKYGVYDLEAKKFIRYEDGPNRQLKHSAAPGRRTIINDGFARFPSTTWKGAGVAIPVFSLRSEKSFGVGEFTDLKLLVDWCKQTGLKLIQILPVNDTIATHTWTDSYPYAAISAFALHPQYLNLSQVATGANKQLLTALESERKRLNALDALDYEAVLKAKISFLKKIYSSEKDKVLHSENFRAFFGQNQCWLVPYAKFSVLRDQHGTVDFSKWPRQELTDEKESPEAGFHYFLQYHLHLQLREAVEYTHANGIILKGDIAIGVYRHGADAWQNPELYHLNMQAGAPPDPFAEKGQNWGFPTYNWPRMKETGFAWWKQRFAQMSNYFDAFRIDHILGFFRIWSIPLNAVEGILGYFVPALPVRPKEFEERGIPLDRLRLVKPWITDDVLNQIFGVDSDFVKTRFLDAEQFGNHSLKENFMTQRQVESFFNAQEQSSHNEKLKIGLFDLISNVILLDEENSDGQNFHFRFGMESTSSFKALDAATQAQLKDLYVDYFFRRQEDFWRKEAMQKLPALKRVTNMLVCGEDLGLVPACVPGVMKELGLLSLEIQRMPKDIGREFSRPAEAPYLSVVTPSTHDMSTIRGWWEEDRSVTQHFYHQELGKSGEAPQTCDPVLNQEIIRQHLASPAMWSVFQVQDFLGMDQMLRRPNAGDDRINVPANPKNYWRYRMHIPLEKLIKERSFNDELKRLVHQSGR